MTKGDIIRKLISEKFASKAQQRFFYAMADKDTKKGRKFKKWAKEFSDDTDFDDLPEKVSEEEKETKNPKMKKGDLVEYINYKKNINESPMDNRVVVIREISRSDFRIIYLWLEKLKESSLINMFGCYPMLNWSEEDLHRWLYGQKMDPESIEEQIEELEYENEDGDNDYEIESLKSQLEIINYLLENKQDVRDALIRTALKRVENTDGNYETKNVQRIFEKLAKEAFVMWTKVIYGDI
jgi:hypothetical protein